MIVPFPFRLVRMLNGQTYSWKPIPHFLFRVYAPRSDGFTETEASSRDATSEKDWSNQDVFTTHTPLATATLIADYLWWTREERSDNLVSLLSRWKVDRKNTPESKINTMGPLLRCSVARLGALRELWIHCIDEQYIIYNLMCCQTYRDGIALSRFDTLWSSSQYKDSAPLHYASISSVD